MMNGEILRTDQRVIQSKDTIVIRECVFVFRYEILSPEGDEQPQVFP